MKRFWIGAGLLVGLLIFGLWSMYTMDTTHSQITEDLHHSAQAAQNGQWTQADHYVRSATEQWEKHWKFNASMTDHTELDDIDALFAQVEIYRQARTSTAFASACVRLAKQIEALQEGHQLSWWNLL